MCPTLASPSADPAARPRRDRSRRSAPVDPAPSLRPPVAAPVSALCAAQPAPRLVASSGVRVPSSLNFLRFMIGAGACSGSSPACRRSLSSAIICLRWLERSSSPAHRKSLIFTMPNQFQSVDQPQPVAASGLPLLVVERNSLTGACRNALNWLENWSIIDLAREGIETQGRRISRHATAGTASGTRVGIAGGNGRSRGGSHARCGQYVQCGGAGRGSVALTAHRDAGVDSDLRLSRENRRVVTRQYPRYSFLHEVALGLWSKLWTPFERLAEIPK